MLPSIFYHCTNTDHGPVLECKRLAPKCTSAKEPKTPRLCVAPSVAQCFAARLFDVAPVHVYRTKDKRCGIAPVDVWDRCVTNERWLIPPMQLVKHGTVPKGVVELVTKHARRAACIKRGFTLHLRVCQYAVAAEFLGTSKDKRRAARCLEALKIQCPYGYFRTVILDAASALTHKSI